MLRGHFGSEGGRIWPYLRCYLEFPYAPYLEGLEVDLLVDTGADRTTISRETAERAGLSLDTLPDGGTSTGVGGVTAVRTALTQLSVQGYSTALWLRILESRHPSASVLGRDFMAGFALFMEERTRRVLFLDADEVAGLGLDGLAAIP